MMGAEHLSEFGRGYLGSTDMFCLDQLVNTFRLTFLLCFDTLSLQCLHGGSHEILAEPCSPVECRYENRSCTGTMPASVTDTRVF